MAFKLHNRVHETSTTGGTGGQALAGPLSGKKSFASRLAANDTTFGTLHQASTNKWVTGLLTFTQPGGVDTITCTTVFESSEAADAHANFTAGQTIEVFIDLPAFTALSDTVKAMLMASMGALAFAAAQSLTDAQKSQALINLGALVAVQGKCRLAKSGANLQLSGHNGNTIVTDSKVRVIPDSGPTCPPPSMTVTMTIANPCVISFSKHGMSAGQPFQIHTTGATPTGLTAGNVYYVSATGLTDDTFQFSSLPGGSSNATTGSQSGVHTLTGPVHYIYAYDDAGTLTLEPALKALSPYAIQSGTGFPIKSGDATRTLVGIGRTENGAWVDGPQKRFVRSYFNRKAIAGYGAFTANRARTNATPGEVHSEIRIEFLIWEDENARVALNPIVFPGTTLYDDVRSFVSFDGGSVELAAAYGQAWNTAQALIPGGIAIERQELSVGYHYVTMFGSSTATGTWVGGATAARTSMWLGIG